jgi:hypothetical protein
MAQMSRNLTYWSKSDQTNNNTALWVNDVAGLNEFRGKHPLFRPSWYLSFFFHSFLIN